jgi:subtilisin-like proprotein convertase family protein
VAVVAAASLAPLVGSSPSVAAETCNTTPITVPFPASGVQAATPYPSVINVAGETGTISKVTVTLKGLTIEAPEDLDVLLVGPDGTNLILMSDIGGNNDFTFAPVNNINLTWDDTGPAAPIDSEIGGIDFATGTAIPQSRELVTGTYHPTDDDTDEGDFVPGNVDQFPAPAPTPSSATALSVFNGKAPNGAWSLYVVDDEPGPDTAEGFNGGWCINITTGSGGTTVPPTTTPPTTTPPTTTPPTTTPPTTTPPTTTPPTTTPPTTTPTPGGDGFENQTGTTPTGNWSISYPDCQGSGTATIDHTVAHTGTTSLRVDGAAGYCNHVFVRDTALLAGTTDTWYVRYYVRHTTALPAQHVTAVAMTDANDGGKDLRFGGQNGAMQFNRASDDATLPEQSPAGVALSAPLPVGTWNCVQFKISGADGTIGTWLNGAAVPGLTEDGVPTHDIDSQWLNRTWRPKLTDLRLGWESYGEGADTLWYDDVAVSPSQIAC